MYQGISIRAFAQGARNKAFTWGIDQDDDSKKGNVFRLTHIQWNQRGENFGMRKYSPSMVTVASPVWEAPRNLIHSDTWIFQGVLDG